MPPLKFNKKLIADERYEAVGVFDVNNDGMPDLVSGAYWYPGPDFSRKCPIGTVMSEGEYFDEFFVIPLDINGNGYRDFVTGGWFGETLRWRENPKGDPGQEWPLHDIAQIGNIETAGGWDIDGDGQIEIVPNTPGGPQRVFKLITDATGKGTGKFQEFIIFDQQSGHGLGVGDIAGNGRRDIVLCNGWLEAPADPWSGKWIFHEEFDLGSASVPILVADVTGNGVNDLIVGQAHGYGLDWWEQKIVNGKRSWKQHPIDPFNSQFHDLRWVDLDNDGKGELVTGKRYRAHCGHDPGAYDPVGIYYYKWTGEAFARQVIDYGPVRQGTGCGIFFQVADLNGNGFPDVIAPGKDGLYLFENLGFPESME